MRRRTEGPTKREVQREIRRAAREQSEMIRQEVRREVQRILGPKASDARHTDDRRFELRQRKEALESDLRRLGADLAAAEDQYVEALGNHTAMHEARDRQRSIREQMREVREAIEDLDQAIRTGYSVNTLEVARAELKRKAAEHSGSMRKALAAALHLYLRLDGRGGLPDIVTENMARVSRVVDPTPVESDDPVRDIRMCLKTAGRHAEHLQELFAEDGRAYTLASRHGETDPPLTHLFGTPVTGTVAEMGRTLRVQDIQREEARQ